MNFPLEMPTSGNLKSGDSFFSITAPPPRQISMINPLDNDPPCKPNSIQSLILHKVQTITISLYECNGKIIFVSDEIHAKMPQEPTFESKKIQILGENGINSKLEHRKAHNSILSWRFGDLYRRLGDCCCIRETPR